MRLVLFHYAIVAIRKPGRRSRPRAEFCAGGRRPADDVLHSQDRFVSHTNIPGLSLAFVCRPFAPDGMVITFGPLAAFWVVALVDTAVVCSDSVAVWMADGSEIPDSLRQGV